MLIKCTYNFLKLFNKDFSDEVESKLPTYGDEWSGVKLTDAQDTIYNADKAKAEFAKSEEAAKERYSHLEKLVKLYGED